VEIFAEPLARRETAAGSSARGALAEALLAEEEQRRRGALPDWLRAGAPVYVARLGSRLRLEWLLSGASAEPGRELTGYLRFVDMEKRFGPRTVSRLVDAVLDREDPERALADLTGRSAGVLEMEWGLHRAEALRPTDAERAVIDGGDAGPDAPAELRAEALLRRALRASPERARPLLDELLEGRPARPLRLDLATLAAARVRIETGEDEEAEGRLRRFLRLFPESPLTGGARVDLARVRLRRGDPGEALRLLEGPAFGAEGETGRRAREVALRAALELELDGLAADVLAEAERRREDSAELSAARRVLLGRADDPPSETQTRRVVSALGVLGAASTTERQRAAARRLVRRVGPRAVDRVEAVALSGSMGAREGATLLAEMGGDRAIAALDRLAREPDPEVAGPAIEALVRGGRDAIALARALEASGAAAGARAALRRATGGADEAVLAELPDLPARLASDDPAVRVATAGELGASGLPGARAPLEVLLRDGDVRVRESAVEALVQLGDAGREPVEEILATGSRRLRLGALDALLRRDPAGAEPWMERLVADPDPTTRAGALAAAGSRAGPGWAGLAVKGLADPNPGVRRIAEAVLVEGPEADAVPELLRAYEAGTPDPAVEARLARVISTRAGRDFGHDPALPAEARRIVLERMRVWWERRAPEEGR
jgi:HEAT repeat protein